MRSESRRVSGKGYGQSEMSPISTVNCTLLWKGRRWLFFLLIVLTLAACGDAGNDALFSERTDAPPSPTSPSAVASQGSPTAPPLRTGPAQTSTPLYLTPAVRPPVKEVLPAPLYFLSDGQIARLETDGVTLTQLTQEREPITDFDVSPVDARLVYVSGNRLIEADPQYGRRTVKLDGGPIDPNSLEDRSVRLISAPHFSPDGRWIVFGWGGVWRIPAGESQDATLLLPSDPYPEPNNPPRSLLRFFTPGPWSPDGARLLVRFAYWPEAGGLALWDVAAGALIELTGQDPNAPLCCHWSWGQRGETGFIASDLLVYGVPGLAQVDARTGEVVPLVLGLSSQGISPETPARLFRSVFQEEDGGLLTFAATLYDPEQTPLYTLQRLSQDGRLALPLREESFSHLLDVLWARDGSGVVIVQGDGPAASGQEGSLLWLPLTDEPAHAFPVRGSHLRWGPSPRSLAVSPSTPTPAVDAPLSPVEQEKAPTATALVTLNIRSGPGTIYPILGELPEGATATITGHSPDRGWWQIAVPGAEEERGWIIGGPAFVLVRNSDQVGVVAAPPLPAPTGRILYPGRDARGRPSIFARSLAPAGEAELLLVNATQPSTSPDGTRLAVRSVRSDLLGIGVYRLDEGSIHGLTSHQEDSLPNWSPTGDRLVFASTRHGDRRWRIYVQPAATPGAAREITFGLDPDWHPRQDLIAYKGCNEVGEQCGIWIMDADGQNRRPLTGNTSDSRPMWTPDGRALVFMSETRDGNWEVYAVDAATGAVTRLTNNPAHDGLPVVSPDGGWVAFVSNRGGVWGVWIVPIQGGVAREVFALGPDLPNWLEEKIDWARSK